MALHDDEMLAILLPVLPFETNQGTTTMPALLAGTDVVRVTETVEEFRQVASVAAAQGVAVVNGGYTFEFELLRRLPEIFADAQVEAISARDIDAHIRTVPDARLLAVRPALDRARAVLDRLDVDLELRAFAPSSLPALYLDDAQARRRRQSREAAATADDTWSAILGSLDDGGVDRPRLLLNDDNPLVQRILAMNDAGLSGLAVESLYCRALLSGQHPMRPADTAAMDRSFLGLLDRALAASGGESGGESGGDSGGDPGGEGGHRAGDS
jgi:molecular chaperone HtpG